MSARASLSIYMDIACLQKVLGVIISTVAFFFLLSFGHTPKFFVFFWSHPIFQLRSPFNMASKPNRTDDQRALIEWERVKSTVASMSPIPTNFSDEDTFQEGMRDATITYFQVRSATLHLL